MYSLQYVILFHDLCRFEQHSCERVFDHNVANESAANHVTNVNLISFEQKELFLEIVTC
jgi:hypothetical protein